MGFPGRIVSFEPLESAYRKLAANARGNPRWKIVNVALGAADGEGLLHVAGNLQSSSLREMLPDHVRAAPESAYIAQQPVALYRLDSIVDFYCRADERCFLKLDVQGGERDVLEGACKSLARCVGIQLEMSMSPLYRGESLFDELLTLMADKGYCPMSITNGFVDPRSQRLLQVDGIFYRRTEVERAALRAA
jgi:FkbM family methyltransferase